MQFDVTLNVTLEVDEVGWADFLESSYGDDDGHYDEDAAIFDGAVQVFVESILDSEEFYVLYGRAWVCGVDDASIL
jgi:hypothetical protein